MIHLVTGAARAGKSRFALEQAEVHLGLIDFVATAQALDDDMRKRIVRHQAERSPRYRTIESAIDVPLAIRNLPSGGAIVLDCLTMWVANLVFAELSDDVILAHIDVLTETLVDAGRPVIVVTNEVGWGIVPADALSRRYRDSLGRCNQIVARSASQVSLLVAGIPMRVK